MKLFRIRLILHYCWTKPIPHRLLISLMLHSLMWHQIVLWIRLLRIKLIWRNLVISIRHRISQIALILQHLSFTTRLILMSQIPVYPIWQMPQIALILVISLIALYPIITLIVPYLVILPMLRYQVMPQIVVYLLI